VIQPNPRLSASSSQDEQFCRKRKRLREANSKRSHQVKVRHYFLYVANGMETLIFEDKLFGSKKRNADQIPNLNDSLPQFNEVDRRSEGVFETILSIDSLANLIFWMDAPI